MIEEGFSKQEILRILEKKLLKDNSYESGNILGSMCTEPLDIGKEIYLKYISKNLGDPGLFQGSFELEKEVIQEIGELLGSKEVIGTFTTGGTEANLIFMRIAKKLRPEIKNPEIIVPASAHMSFDKGQDLLGVTLKKARLDENFELDLNHFESLINKNTCGVLGIAGTTALGLIDPIEKIGKIIESQNIFFHVDAAFGGFVLPFLKDLNYQVLPWDFSVEAVDSITADPHKMGLGLIPSGGFLLRDATILQKTGYVIPYLAGGGFSHLHIVGTRSGAPVIAFWAIMKSLGKKGFTKIIKRCMENTHFLAKGISEINGVKLVAEPKMNVVGISTENNKSICEIDEELRKRNWMLGKFEDLNLIRIVVMPHVTKEHLTKFLEDLKEVLKKLKI